MVAGSAYREKGQSFGEILINSAHREDELLLQHCGEELHTAP